MGSLAGVDLCAIPLGTKADGTWDFVNYETLEAPSIGICVSLTVLATLVAAPRIYVNRRHLKPADCEFPVMTRNDPVLIFMIDFTILAVVFVIAYAALIILSAWS